MKYILFATICITTSLGYAQEFYDIDKIQRIDVSFSQSNWDALMDAQKAGAGDYILAQSVSINGVEFDSVGVKFKGNSSYNSNQTKNPWHIELDTYKDHEYDGYTDIKLANGHNDPSFVRDVLGFQIVRQYMDAPLSNYANLYVNGNLIGLYTNTESISKKFVDSRFGSKKNAFFDCSPPGGAGPQSNDFPNLVYLGQDSTAYFDSYDIKSDEGWQELIDLCDTLSNNLEDIEKILDVDRALWMLAFDNVIVNLDSYIGQFTQNYYLYRSDFGQFLPIVWDLNESFGVFAQTGSGNLNTTAAKQQMDHLLHSSDAGFPLVRQLLSVPMYRRMYVAHVKTILLENFDNGSYLTTAQELQSVIDASVQADPNKLFTYNNFIANLTTDINSGGGGRGRTIPGITGLMDGRNSYLLAQSDFQQGEPSIENVSLSTAEPIINETVNINATITDANTVFLAYRSDPSAPFTKVDMLDDGTNNDGAANDGVYGAAVVIDNSSVQYYIYAENTNTGLFSPRRAEHEFYELTATTAPLELGDLVINELMASNEETVGGPDDEFDDWIELYNNGSSTIDLEGYFLSDDLTDLMQWPFPAGTTIEPQQYLIVWADDDEDQAELHANFKLSASEESLYLVNAAGEIADEVSFADQMTDISYGRFPNGTGSFQTMDPTYNAENAVTTSVGLVRVDGLQFNAYPNPADDFLHIELTDTEELEISIYDIRGQLKMKEMMSKNKKIDTSDWASGMYVIKVKNSLFKVAIN